MKYITSFILLLLLFDCHDNSIINVGNAVVNGTNYKVIRKSPTEQPNSVRWYEPTPSFSKFVKGEKGICVLENVSDNGLYIAYNPLKADIVVGTKGLQSGDLYEEDNYVIGSLESYGPNWSRQHIRPRFLVKKIETIEGVKFPQQLVIAAGYKESNKSARITLLDFHSGNLLIDFEYKNSQSQGTYLNDFFTVNIVTPQVKQTPDIVGQYGYDFNSKTYLYGVGSVSLNGVLKPYVLTIELTCQDNLYGLKVIGEQIFNTIEGEFDYCYNDGNIIIGHSETNIILLANSNYDFPNTTNNIYLKTWQPKLIDEYAKWHKTKVEAERNLRLQENSFRFLIESPFKDAVITKVYSPIIEIASNKIDGGLVTDVIQNGITKTRFYKDLKNRTSYREFSRGKITYDGSSGYTFYGGYPVIEKINDVKKEITINGGFGESIDNIYSTWKENWRYQGNDNEMHFFTGYKSGATQVQLDYDPTKKALILKSCKGWIAK